MKAIERFENYSNNRNQDQKDNYKNLDGGQSPKILFITCSDSRVMPNEMMGAKAGEVFVIRNAGNLMPASSSGSSSEALTLEYAVSVLGVEEIIVCGHAQCGAMGGILDLDKLTSLKCVHEHLDKASNDFSKDYLNNLRSEERATSLPKLIESNIGKQMLNIMSYGFVKEKVDEGKLNLHGWVYDFVSGQITHQKDIKDLI